VDRLNAEAAKALTDTGRARAFIFCRAVLASALAEHAELTRLTRTKMVNLIADAGITGE
jgi:hypothetical protein